MVGGGFGKLQSKSFINESEGDRVLRGPVRNDVALRIVVSSERSRVTLMRCAGAWLRIALPTR